MKMKRDISDKVFDFVNYTVMVIIGAITLYPFIYLLMLSFSESSVTFSAISFLPDKFVLMNYERIFSYEYILTGYINTIIRTATAVLLGVTFMVMAAYPLSKKHFPLRNFWTGIIIFTMFFQGGLIPRYLLIKDLGMMNSLWALILPRLINTFIMIIMRNFFMTIPESLEESARIDGANDISILFRIILPLSKPIITTAALWIAVEHWNAWFDALIYISDHSKQVLQVVIRRLVIDGAETVIFNSGAVGYASDPEAIKAAAIMVATLPILMVFPFVQKYFAKGVIVGSLKG